MREMTEVFEQVRLCAGHRTGDQIEVGWDLVWIIGALQDEQRRLDGGKTGNDVPAVGERPAPRAYPARQQMRPAIAMKPFHPGRWRAGGKQCIELVEIHRGGRIDGHMGRDRHQSPDPGRPFGGVKKRDRAAIAVPDRDAIVDPGRIEDFR